MRYKVCNKEYLAEREKYLAERKKYQGENKKSLRRQFFLSAQSVAMVNYVTRPWRVAFLWLTAQNAECIIATYVYPGRCPGLGATIGLAARLNYLPIRRMGRAFCKTPLLEAGAIIYPCCTWGGRFAKLPYPCGTRLKAEGVLQNAPT